MKREFAFLSFLLILSRALDLWSTHLATPTLSDEMNPVVSVFGLGWNAILVANFAIIAALIYLNYYQLHKYSPKVSTNEFNSLPEYLSFAYFDRTDYRIEIFYKWPKDWVTFKAHFGYAGIRGMIVGSILASANNLFRYYKVEFYSTFASWIRHPAYTIYIIIGLSFIGFQLYFAFKEYKHLKANDHSTVRVDAQ